MEKALEVLAKQAGIDSIDAVILSTEVASKRRKTLAQDGQLTFIEILEKAKSEYNSLAAACAKKDWKAVDVYGDNLADLLSGELLGAFSIKYRRERLKAEGHLNQQTEYDLLMWERRKKEIEAFFGDKIDMENLHRLIAEIEDLSDKVRDCARDKQFVDDIPICFAELKKRWKLLLSYVNQM